MVNDTITASARIVVGPRMDAITAWKRGNQPSMDLAREAIIVNQDPRLLRRYSLTEEWYASPGLSRPTSHQDVEQMPLERDWLASAQKDEFGREVVVDLHALPVTLSGLKIPLVTFVPEAIEEDRERVVIRPKTQTIKTSVDAPLRSSWSRLKDGIFERIEGADRKSLPPVFVAFPWINEDPSVGPSAVYGDASGQGVQVYYMPDYRGQYLRLATPEEIMQQSSGRLITESVSAPL
ncbi:MAG: hypothetical protein ACHQX1_00185 [Candidatus Micrarchaeales archaeon]